MTWDSDRCIILKQRWAELGDSQAISGGCSCLRSPASPCKSGAGTELSQLGLRAGLALWQSVVGAELAQGSHSQAGSGKLAPHVISAQCCSLRQMKISPGLREGTQVPLPQEEWKVLEEYRRARNLAAAFLLLLGHQLSCPLAVVTIMAWGRR